jgi:hypothetical protein
MEAMENKRLHILYFNGLGTGKTRRREIVAMRYLEKRGLSAVHVHVDWYSNEPFEDLLDRMLRTVEAELQNRNKVILVGSSAGGSLVVNILGKLHNKNVLTISLCSRLHLAKLPWWDWRSLKRMAYMGKPKESRNFYESVTYCSKVTIPRLTQMDKKRLVIVRQWADDIVPRATMDIDGVRVFRAPALGHGWGIAMGVRRLPKIIEVLTRNKENK